MIIIKYILYYKLYIPRFWLSISKNVTRYLVFSFVIFLFLPINETYPNNLCDKLAALESDPKKTSKPVLLYHRARGSFCCIVCYSVRKSDNYNILFKLCPTRNYQSLKLDTLLKLDQSLKLYQPLKLGQSLKLNSINL